MSKTRKTLEGAGFQVKKTWKGARWFEVVAPGGSHGYVLCQSMAAWHFFYFDFIGTASSSNPERCHLGGLGDAIGTESQMNTYKKLMRNTPRELRGVGSIAAAISQTYY